ncbi:hypothetical protein [Halothermothrix orenii]|nr:hypothetical protein [Halothermothrix orenii]
MINLGIHGYEFSNLSEKEIDKIKHLEEELNREKEDNIIILAFEKE